MKRSTFNNNGLLNAVAIAMIAISLVQPAMAQSSRHAADAVNADRVADAGFDRTARIHELAHAAAGHDHGDEGSGGCVALPQFSIMFDPTTTETEIEATLDQIPDDGLAAFIEHSRWTSTATNGAISADDDITLTYSFVPDGTSIFLSTTGDSADSDLFSTFDNGYPGGRAAWQAKVREMFDRWSELTNITYVEVSDDGAGFPLAPGALGSRGDVRIAARPIGAPLAVNFYPAFGGDMIIDSNDIGTFANSSDDFVRFFNVLAHEHGHGLGLQHVEPQNSTKLMEPALNTNFYGPQEDDIRGGRYFYGDAEEPNNSFAETQFYGETLRNPSSAGVQLFSIEEVALERQGASDFYKFTAFAQIPIAIRVEPIGTQYEFGPQGGSASLFNAKAARDLGLRLYRHAGNGQLQLLTVIDFNEAGEDEYHPPLTYQLAGQMVLEVYSNDGLDDVQNYRVQISNSTIEESVEPAELRVFEGFTELGDSSTVRFLTPVTVGDSQTRQIQISNSGTGPLEIGNITIAGPAANDYGVTLLQNTVQPGAVSNLLLSFAPTNEGSRVAVVQIPNNDPNRGDFSFIVQGTGEAAPAPEILVDVDGASFDSDDTVNLGELAVGDTVEIAVEIRNDGDAPLTLTPQLFSDGIMNLAYDGVATIQPNNTAATMLSVTQLQEGAASGQLRLTTNADIAQFLVNVESTGFVAITDCNNNGVDDATDIANGTSTDCDGNSVPDECEADSDNDGVIDACDQFPGQDDNLDSDNDGVVDGLDECPNDPNKIAEGACGCGVADEDDDNDGILNCDDAFPNDPNNGVDPDDNGGNDGDDENDGNIGDDDDVIDDDNGNDDDIIDDDNGNNDDQFNDDDELIDGDAGQDVNDDADEDDFGIELNDDGGLDMLPNPCGFGLVPGLMFSALSLTAGRKTHRRNKKA